MVAVGLGILAVIFGIASLLGGQGRAVIRALGFFAALWLGVTGVDLYLGVTGGERSLESEIVPHLLIFGIPAAVALFLAVRTSRRRTARQAARLEGSEIA